MSIANFLLELNRAVSVYTSDMMINKSKNIDERRLQSLKLLNISMLYDVIQFYFREDSSITSDNIMTDEEIQLIISKINNLMGTYLYVTL